MEITFENIDDVEPGTLSDPDDPTIITTPTTNTTPLNYVLSGISPSYTSGSDLTYTVSAYYAACSNVTIQLTGEVYIQGYGRPSFFGGAVSGGTPVYESGSITLPTVSQDTQYQLILKMDAYATTYKVVATHPYTLDETVLGTFPTYSMASNYIDENKYDGWIIEGYTEIQTSYNKVGTGYAYKDFTVLAQPPLKANLNVKVYKSPTDPGTVYTGGSVQVPAGSRADVWWEGKGAVWCEAKASYNDNAGVLRQDPLGTGTEIIKPELRAEKKTDLQYDTTFSLICGRDEASASSTIITGVNPKDEVSDTSMYNDSLSNP